MTIKYVLLRKGVYWFSFHLITGSL